VKHILVLAVAFCHILLPAAAVHAQSGGTFDLTWFSVDGGGASTLTGGTFGLSGSAGQPDAAGLAGGTFALQGGFWNPSSTAPLAATLASFSAVTDGQQVLVTWETVSEIDNAGFKLYRGTGDDWGSAALLTFAPSQAPGSSQGFSYSVSDVAVEPGLTYWYWLEDLSLAGVATGHGPVSVTVIAPTAVRIGALVAEVGSSAMLWPLAAAVLALAVALLTGAARRWRRLVR
jgi:hypothetical protein